VVSGRADDDERGVGLATGQRFRGAQPTPGGAGGRGEGSRRDHGVGVEHPATTARELREGIDVALVVHEGELGLRRVTTAVPRDGIVEVRVGHPGDRGLHPADAFGMTAARVVGVGVGRYDDEQTRRHRRPVDPRFQLAAGATDDGSRRSITRGIRRRRPKRRPASIRPSSSPMSAPTSTTTRKVFGIAPAKYASAARSMVRCTRKTGDDRTRPQRRVAQQHGEAQEREQVGGAVHLVDVSRERAEHEPRAHQPADRGTRAPLRGVAPVVAREARTERSDQDHCGHAVDQLFTGDGHHDALDIAELGDRLRVRDAPHEEHWAAKDQELPPGREAPAREAEVARTDHCDQGHPEGQGHRHRDPAEVPLRLPPP